MLKLLHNLRRREWTMAAVCTVLILGQIYFDLSLPDYMSNLTVLIKTPGSTMSDILDTGLTLSYLKDMLAARNPASIRIATLLDKPDRRKADIKADYIGYRVPDEFVVGYGLDYDEKYRNLPYVGVLKPEIYSE